MVEKTDLVTNVIQFIKESLENITDPISSSRSSKSKFVMTSYPQRPVEYPIITIKLTNKEALRAGMQTTTQDITLTLEIRIWARNEKEKDEIYTEVSNRLANIQFTDSGSIENNLHDYNELSATEVDDVGEPGGKITKSRVMQVQYKFYNI